MDLVRLNQQVDRLWGRAQRLVDLFLKQQIALAKKQTDSEPDAAAMRELQIAVNCLKRIYEGRRAALPGGDNAFQLPGSNESAAADAEEISRRIQAMLESGASEGDDEDPL